LIADDTVATVAAEGWATLAFCSLIVSRQSPTKKKPNSMSVGVEALRGGLNYGFYYYFLQETGDTHTLSLAGEITRSNTKVKLVFFLGTSLQFLVWSRR
jgi:hypothetical protein